MDTMHDYIREEPSQFLENINNSKQLTNVIVEAYTKKKYKRICIIACGSSYNATVAAKYFIEEILKVKVEVITSFTFQNYETVFDEDTFYIGIGQSGRSNNTNAAMSLVRDAGYDVVGVTGNVDSEMKNHCNYICNWGMGIEKIGFVTKGYSTAILFYVLFAIEVALKLNIINEDEYNTKINELKDVCKAIEINIPIVEKWYKDNEEFLYGINRVQVCGYGPSFGVALEGGLKCEETMSIASTGYEMEEYLHGPYYETNNTRTVFVIDSLGKPSDRAIDLYHKLHTLTDKVFLITNKKFDDQKVLTLNHDLSEYNSAFVNVLAFQVIAAHGHDKWQNPNEETRIKFINDMDAKAPKKGNEVGL